MVAVRSFSVVEAAWCWASEEGRRSRAALMLAVAPGNDGMVMC